MADNVSITEGSGKTVASDEVAGVNYQQVKLTDGTLDSTTGIYSGAGVSTNAMRVTMASDSASAAVHLLSTGGTINVALKPGTIAVSFDPGHTLGAVTGSGTFGVYLDSTAGTVNIALKPGTIAVSLDPGHLLGSVTANAGSGTMTVAFDPGHELGSIKGVNTTVGIYIPDTGHTLGKVDAGAGTFNVQLDPGHTLGNIATLGSITNTVAVFFSPASPAVSATFSAASIEVVPTTGSRKTMDDAHAAQRVLIVGSQTAASVAISSINTTVAVFFSPANPSVNATFSSTSLEVVPSTGSRKMVDDAAAAMRVLVVGTQTNASLTINGTVTANAGSGTMTVQFDPGHTLGSLTSLNSITTTVTVKIDPGTTLGKVDQGVGGTSGWLANIGGTASLFTVAGSTSGISVSGVTLISPSANASFKIFAYSLQTTGAVSLTAKFTNGAGSGPTEFWRPLITASGVTGAQGANLATQPGAPLFVTGTSTTLSLVLDTATLVHYSVSYTKESA